jgi:error-prone DNA polymerase
LCELVPIKNAAMPNRTVIEWNKDDLDELGILKVDCLALGMLTAIRKCFQLVFQHHGRRLTLANIPEGDEDVYAMIRQADTMGVFQIESRAQMSMLPRLRPRCFYDLVIEVAIMRPGPIQGNMVHPYLRRRNGEESVSYPNDAIRGVLEKTLGVPLFQEQAMRLAVEAAGFTPGEADQLRRAMGAWRRPGIIDQFRKKLIDGMRLRGFSPAYAESVFEQIRGFGAYGFPESHAASFALLVYVSAWLKCHYPAAFTAALLNSQPMGFYAPAQLVRCAREHGVAVRPVDVNHSRWDCTLEKQPESEIACVISDYGRTTSLRLGFNMLLGMSAHDAETIELARAKGPFCSISDFTHKTGLGRATIARLAKAGVFGSLQLNRRDSLWHALAEDKKLLPLFDTIEVDAQQRLSQQQPSSQRNASLCDIGLVASVAQSPLPQMSPVEEVLADYRTMRLSLSAHPMEFLRADLDAIGVVPASQLKTIANNSPVCVAGIVLVRQRPSTAKGITFVTLEDETGQANLIVRAGIWNRYREAAIGGTLLLAHGRLQRHADVIHILTTRLEDLSDRLRGICPQSRDFC